MNPTVSNAALPGVKTEGLSKLLKRKVWTCSSEKLDFTLMPGQRAQKAHSPAHLQIVEGKAVMVCFIQHPLSPCFILSQSGAQCLTWMALGQAVWQGSHSCHQTPVPCCLLCATANSISVPSATRLRSHWGLFHSGLSKYCQNTVLTLISSVL